MGIRTSYKHTIAAAYIGYVTQAIINNFAPLLFLTFSTAWGIPLPKMALLVSINFGLQLIIDFFSAKFVDRIGYRPCIVTAHIAAAMGLLGLGIFPNLFSEPYYGILLAVAIYALGGGLTEVLISPIVEACPKENNESRMSLLHSSYCWGHVFVILGSTLFFFLFGIERWPILAAIWALIPALNAVYFMFVPIRQLNEDPQIEPMSIKKLICQPIFWLFILIMFCSGASEQSMSQWASAFAEAGLGVTKAVGDITGTCMFAILMGISRVVSSKITKKMPTKLWMILCCGLCIVSYLLASLSASPIAALIGCGLCGFSVGIMWPGTFTMAADGIRGGGTAMFAFLALAGDLGCMGGPAAVGLATDLMGGSLKSGMIWGVVFPIVLVIGLLMYREKKAHSPHTVDSSRLEKTNTDNQ